MKRLAFNSLNLMERDRKFCQEPGEPGGAADLNRERGEDCCTELRRPSICHVFARAQLISLAQVPGLQRFRPAEGPSPPATARVLGIHEHSKPALILRRCIWQVQSRST
jgi:hypothetical protein